jgi:glutathione reductase (NADPH)
VIAAGAEPVRLGIDGEPHFATSEQFLDLDARPARPVFAGGGGYIGAKFPHLAARAGVQATVLQGGAHLLPGFDPGLSAC